LRQELSDVHSDRDAWRSEVERLILIEYRRNERERLPWWTPPPDKSEERVDVAFAQLGSTPLRQELSDVHSDRDAWRSEVERLILIEYRRNERERLPWWKRVAGWAPHPPKTPRSLLRKRRET
jgi:hypothetical protein